MRIIQSRRSWTDEQLIEAVKTSKTLSEVGRKLGLTTYGANSRTIKKRIEVLELTTSHFWSRSEQLVEARKNSVPMTNNELFAINNADRSNLKRIIIRDQLIPYTCAICPVESMWEGETLSLHLDHINGVSNDNRLSNLRFLCPNCHSQTSTYCGKQLKNNVYSDPRCIDCDSSVHKTSKRCQSCAAKLQRTKITWPATSLLAMMVEEMGYQETARRLEVSGNAIKKRIRNHP